MNPFNVLASGLFMSCLHDVVSGSSADVQHLLQTSTHSSILETTYTYPLAFDPIIYNLPSNGSNNTTRLRKTQIQGRIYLPEIMGKKNSTPIVVLFPGKHADCRGWLNIDGYGQYPLDEFGINDEGVCLNGTTLIPSNRGFDYLGRSLANEGYAVLSIDPLMLNNAPQSLADDPNLIRARARLLLRTLEKVELWNSDREESKRILGRDISGQMNISAIGLMGHSRGGGATRLAANMLMTPERLGFKEITNWPSKLKSRIEAVFDVAPADSPEGGKDVTVVGLPWGLMAAGCENDEIDYAYYSLYQRQSKLNRSPNYFITAYGTGHNFFNSEWRVELDTCLGDQIPTYDPATPTIQYFRPLSNKFLEVPLVEQSKSTQGVLKWALVAFMKAHVGKNANPALAAGLRATASTPDNGKIADVEIGVSNPNLATSTILQDFRVIDNISTASGHRYVKSLASHAEHQYPSFKSDVDKFGLPRNFATRVVTKPFELLTNVEYDLGAVVGLPASNRTWVYVPFTTPLDTTKHSEGCEIQVDIARRDPCMLSALAPDHGKSCSKPRNLQVQFHVGDNVSTVRSLRSRYSVEFAPYDVSIRDDVYHKLALLRPAWETISIVCPKQSTVAGINMTITVPSDEKSLPDVNSSFIYLGPIRQVSV